MVSYIQGLPSQPHFHLRKIKYGMFLKKKKKKLIKDNTWKNQV